MRVEEHLKHAEELLSAYLTTIKEKTALIENMDAELEHLKQVSYPVNNMHGIAANMEALSPAPFLQMKTGAIFAAYSSRYTPVFCIGLKKNFQTFRRL